MFSTSWYQIVFKRDDILQLNHEYHSNPSHKINCNTSHGYGGGVHLLTAASQCWSTETHNMDMVRERVTLWWCIIICWQQPHSAYLPSTYSHHMEVVGKRDSLWWGKKGKRPSRSSLPLSPSDFKRELLLCPPMTKKKRKHLNHSGKWESPLDWSHAKHTMPWRAHTHINTNALDGKWLSIKRKNKNTRTAQVAS